MGHPKDNIQFGIPLPSADGKYRSRYPLGDWPGISANASGGGVTRPASTPVGLAVGAAIAAAAGANQPAVAPQGAGGGSGAAAGAGISVAVSAPAASASFGGQSGLQFPSNGAANSDIRLNWLGANLLSRTSQTVITKVRYTQQTGYYALIWNCHNDGTFHYDKYEVGAHPYPATGSVDSSGQSTGGTQSSGTTHFFELAGLGDFPPNQFGHDYLASPNNAHGTPRQVVKNRDYVHIRTIAVEGSNLVHRFWPDALNDPTFRIEQSIPLSSLPSSSAPVFLLGCSPWTSSNFASTGAGATNSECPSGVLRGIKLFSQPLSFSDALAEANSGLNSAVTAAGQASVWYINENPTPTDITDKSGAGHTPTWANANRPSLWSAASSPTGAGANATASAPTGSASSNGAMIHGQEFTINGTFGTRPNYNVDNYPWVVGGNTHNHMHYRFTDFRNGFPADGSTKATYLAQLSGFFPGELFEFVNNLAARQMTIENGGPSRSGKFFRSVSNGFAQGDYMMVQSDNNAGIPSNIGFYACWKQRGATGAAGKKFRWRQVATGKNFYLGTTGLFRESEYYDSSFYSNNVSPTTWKREEIVADLDPNISTYRNNGVRPPMSAFVGGNPVLPDPFPLPIVNSGDSNRGSYWTWHNSVDSGQFFEFADIFLDFSKARVEVWNLAGTIREIQFCIAWNGSITFAVNKGEISAGPVQIKIFNASDAIIATIDAVMG